MKAKELLKAVVHGCIETEQSGFASGAAIIEAGPYRYFGANSSGIGIKSDKDYIYYYGEESAPVGMPEPTLTMPYKDEEYDWDGVIYLWEIEEED